MFRREPEGKGEKLRELSRKFRLDDFGGSNRNNSSNIGGNNRRGHIDKVLLSGYGGFESDKDKKKEKDFNFFEKHRKREHYVKFWNRDKRLISRQGGKQRIYRNGLLDSIREPL